MDLLLGSTRIKVVELLSRPPSNASISTIGFLEIDSEDRGMQCSLIWTKMGSWIFSTGAVIRRIQLLMVFTITSRLDFTSLKL